MWKKLYFEATPTTLTTPISILNGLSVVGVAGVAEKQILIAIAGYVPEQLIGSRAKLLKKLKIVKKRNVVPMLYH